MKRFGMEIHRKATFLGLCSWIWLLGCQAPMILPAEVEVNYASLGNHSIWVESHQGDLYIQGATGSAQWVFNDRWYAYTFTRPAVEAEGPYVYYLGRTGKKKSVGNYASNYDRYPNPVLYQINLGQLTEPHQALLSLPFPLQWNFPMIPKRNPREGCYMIEASTNQLVELSGNFEQEAVLIENLLEDPEGAVNSWGQEIYDLSPDERFFALNQEDPFIDLFDLLQQSRRRESITRDSTGSQRIHDLAFSPDGLRLAYSYSAFPLEGGGRYAEVVIIRVEDFRVQHRIHFSSGEAKHANSALDLSWSPSGEQMLISILDRVYLLEVETEQYEMILGMDQAHQYNPSFPLRKASWIY